MKSWARAAGFLAYFLITLEMIFMVTPFALYYYSAYAPFLSAASDVRASLATRVFLAPPLDGSGALHRRPHFTSGTRRIFCRRLPDLLREVPEARSCKRWSLQTRTSSTISIFGNRRSWSIDYLAAFHPAHHLRQRTLVLL